jgi:hypothetical protein
VHLRAPRLHHQPPVWLLVVRRAHLPYLRTHTNTKFKNRITQD